MLEGEASDVFGPGGGNGAAQRAVDVKSPRAKINELTLEISARRELSVALGRLELLYRKCYRKHLDPTGYGLIVSRVQITVEGMHAG